MFKFTSLLFFLLFISTNLHSQHDHGYDPCIENANSQFNRLIKDAKFKESFKQTWKLDFDVFADNNLDYMDYFEFFFRREVCEKNLDSLSYTKFIFSLVEKYKDELLFDKEILSNDEVRVYGKYSRTNLKNPDKTPNDGTPKALNTCDNIGFEYDSYYGWQSQCGRVQCTSSPPTTWLEDIDTYNPSALGGCPNFLSPQQHRLYTGGTDPITGFPRVYPGGGNVSMRLGNGTNVNNRVGISRKTFYVDGTIDVITYHYAAVLEAPHTYYDSPYFRARVIDGFGNYDPCAEYFAWGGDGQPGWIVSSGVQYRDWTSVSIPLAPYIGQTITIEFIAADCCWSAHYGYVYLDLDCGVMELKKECKNGLTTLIAPAGTAYLWSTGETTREIGIVAPGNYSCEITPANGAGCVITLDTTITEPFPNAIIEEDTIVCQGEPGVEVTFTGSQTNNGYTFFYNINNGAEQSVSTSLTGSQAVLNVPTSIPGSYYYKLLKVNELGDLCGVPLLDSVLIKVVAPPTGTITGTTAICQNDTPPNITFTGSGGTSEYIFTYTINGGVAQTVTTSGSNTISITASTNTIGSFVYELINVQDASTGCSQTTSSTATVTVNTLPDATLASSTIVCQNDPEPTITFSGLNGTSEYTFSYAINNGISQTVTTSGSNSIGITAPTATPGNFTYKVITVQDDATGCSTNQNDSILIVVNPMPSATISGATVVCRNDTQPVITFTGSNSSSNYTFTYSLNNGANQTLTTAIDSNQATISVPTSAPGTFSYELISVVDPATSCGQNINETEIVVVNPLPTAIVTGTTTICQHATEPQVTFTGNLVTSEYIFTYTINSGAPQTVTTSGSNSVTVNVPTSSFGTYAYTLISVEDVSTGCSNPQSGTVTILINQTPTATIDSTMSVCQNSPSPQILFEGQNSSGQYTFSYTINGGPTQTVTSTNGLSATVNQSTAIPGNYVYNLINVMDPYTMCNTDLNLMDTITVIQLPTASISNPLEACHMDTGLPVVTFTGANGQEPYIFTYNINGGTDQYATSTGSTSTFQVPTNTVGDFVYTITHVEEGSALGCQQAQNESTMVTIHALPIVDAGADITICAGVEIVLTGSGAQTYAWDNGAINGVPFSPAETTTYTVVGTDYNGCQNTDQVTVDVVPIPVMVIDGQNLSGCAPVTPILTNNSTGNLTNCTWYLGNGDTIQSCGTITSVFPNPGCFDVTLVVSTPEGCTNSLTMNQYICVDPLPVASFYPKPDQLSTYDWESQMMNESSGATTFDWNFGDGTPIGHGESPTHEFPNEEEGEYTIQLVAHSPNGCTDTTYGKVFVKEELLFYVPNTFTPDGDAFNQTFKPVFSTGFDPYNYELLIFNRWGELIFESHDTNVGWNGRYGVNGDISQDGTYTWKISVKRRTSDERKQYVGHVNLLR